MSRNTPEGRVKKGVTKLFSLYMERMPCYVWMPVLRMGKPSLDYVCCVRGRFVAVETKAPGEWLTIRQRATAREMLASGAKVFIVSNEEGLAALERYLEAEAALQEMEWLQERERVSGSTV